MPKPRSRKPAGWILIPLAGLGLLGAGSPAGAGTNPCGTCHEEQAKFYEGTIHRIPMQGSALGSGCESCHGAGKAHMENPSPDSIRNKKTLSSLTAEEKNRACLSCHGEVYRSKKSARHNTHAKVGVTCWDCHPDALHIPAGSEVGSNRSAMAAPFMAKNPNEACLRCHEDQRMDFALPYRHPVDRGQIRCWDCHGVHAEDPALSASEAKVTALCTKCHREQEGPFVWRHLAVDDGSCMACHTPHASVNPRLLMESSNGLCVRCHFETSFPTVGAVNHAHRLDRHARCLDCHTATHGSNVSDTFLR